jgi:uncharacterized protein YceK
MITVDTIRRARRAGRVVVLAAVVALTGCATIRSHEAASTEQLLAAAGFKMRPADTPQRLAHLKSMPPLKLVPRGQDATVVYTYADPDNCHCLYVGGPTEYSAYERLRLQQEIAADQREAEMEWPWWGPWPW